MKRRTRVTLTANAQRILAKRYLGPGEDWEQLCRRVARTVAADEVDDGARGRWRDRYLELLMALDFLPNTPVLSNFGRNKGCGSACFVLPVDDSRRSIFETLADAVDIQAYGGGTGMSFSRLRPSGDPVQSTGGRASGPLSFIRIFDHTIGDTIRQGGIRRGANMGILRIDHPDIDRFITAKAREGDLRHFNLSVGITDTFMQAVDHDREFDLTFQGRVYATVSARGLWDRLIRSAWENGEPGVVFLDTINRFNPLRPLGEIEATNPCGEQPLMGYGSCTLGSVNLSRMVTGDWTAGRGRLDTGRLTDTVRVAVRFLDSVVSVNPYPLAVLGEFAHRTRQIGLGVMGFADACIKLGVRYGSAASLELVKEIMPLVAATARETSEALADEKGAAPVYDEVDMGMTRRRNATLTSIAPTGTLSLLADCSSGCEPHFAFSYQRSGGDDGPMEMLPAVARQWRERHPDGNLPPVFVTAGDVSLEDHVRVQAAFQNSGVDAGVSKTINAPYDTRPEAVGRAFQQAWQLGCKGLTFYRDGSRQTQVLATGSRPVGADLPRGELKGRPRATVGPSLKMKTACGSLYVDPHFDADGIIEVFIRTVGGGCEANTRALGILMSYCLRAGIPADRMIRTLKSIHCRACTKAISAGKDVEVTSCVAGMGKGLEVALKSVDLFREAARETIAADHLFNGRDPLRSEAAACPDCGHALNRTEGCLICPNPGCGWNRC
jgi:ribonucleoside-diphosphate reductase alpha chain